MKSIESDISLEKKAKTIVDKFSEKIEVSRYQQKSTINALVKVEKEISRINSTSPNASEKTKALETLAKKKEYALRSILNDQQYEMLIAVLEDQ
jgi:3-methyladenine DNA glycosylase/8-oxoguanine DNA glycosylase